MNDDVSSMTNPEAHLLVVDDKLTARTVLNDILSSEYQVSTVDSGQGALDFLARQSIDLLLLDLSLPDIDGLDVLKTLRQNPVTSDLPVIVISARSDPQDVVEAISAGANDYISKPLTALILRARIAMHLKLKHLMDERQRTIEQLERHQHLREQLSHIASHDLKNPLNNLRLAEELLREETAGNPRARQLLNTIDASLDMMQQVVAAFLDMVAIQTGGIKLRISEVRLSDVIHNVVAQYELSASEKAIELVIESKEGTILADSGRMIQVAGNLVSNAIKYSPRNSKIHIWTELEGDHIRLLVADNGPGIPVEERDRLFQEFSKLSTRPTGGEGRTGLGLWIVKHLIDLQNGTVGTYFPENGGSVFWVSLPRA